MFYKSILSTTIKYFNTFWGCHLVSGEKQDFTFFLETRNELFIKIIYNINVKWDAYVGHPFYEPTNGKKISFSLNV